MSDANWDAIKEGERRKKAYALLRKIKEVERELKKEWGGMDPKEFEEFLYRYYL